MQTSTHAGKKYAYLVYRSQCEWRMYVWSVVQHSVLCVRVYAAKRHPNTCTCTDGIRGALQHYIRIVCIYDTSITKPLYPLFLTKFHLMRGWRIWSTANHSNKKSCIIVLFSNFSPIRIYSPGLILFLIVEIRRCHCIRHLLRKRHHAVTATIIFCLCTCSSPMWRSFHCCSDHRFWGNCQKYAPQLCLRLLYRHVFFACLTYVAWSVAADINMNPHSIAHMCDFAYATVFSRLV